MSDDAPAEGRRLPRRFRFRQHFWSYVAVSAALLLAELASGADLWIFWPMFTWTVGLSVHYFIASAHDVDEAWLEDRIIDLKSRSYDFDHIRNIEERVVRHDYSVTPHTERDSGPGDGEKAGGGAATTPREDNRS